MGSKIKANIEIQGKVKHNEKSILLNFQYEVDKTRPFAINGTLYVPKANPDEKMPKVALTIGVGADSVRIVSATADDIEGLIYNMYEWIAENKEIVQKIVMEQQLKWKEKQVERIDKLTNPMGILKFGTDGENK